MTPTELARWARRLELGCRQQLRGLPPGWWRSRQRSVGRAFEELRPYLPGDDVRDLAWKPTARRGAPIVKVFAGEQQQRMWLIVDQAPGMGIEREGRSKSATAVTLASLITVAVMRQQDRIGLGSLQHDRPLLPDRRGKIHSRRVLLRLADLHVPQPSIVRAAPTAAPTELKAWRWMRAQRQAVHWIVLSDFVDAELTEQLRRLACRHAVTAVRLNDPWERALPATGGLQRLRDIRTGAVRIVDPNSRRFQQEYTAAWEQRRRAWHTRLAGNNVRRLDLVIDDRPIETFIRQMQDWR